jgi:hypothetical protein
MRMGLLLLSVSCIALPSSGQPVPPLTNQLHLVSIKAIPFKIRVKNWTTNDIGREIAGFKLVRYESLSEEREVDGQKRTLDVSRLHLERDGKVIIAVKSQDMLFTEYTVRLLFSPTAYAYELKTGSNFTVDDRRLTLVDIDHEHRQSTIVDQKSKERFVLDLYKEKSPPTPSSDAPKPPPEK